ncbi:MAG: Ig-like domain-containing protein [Bacteroidales bacterium]|nr:Ig-like domain-containing protein [Bacteroidales bacterium]
MKRLITLAAIAAIALASCTEKPEFQVTPAGQENMASVSSTVFSATTEGAVTKTTLSGDDDNGYVVNWQENDRIVVVDGDDHFGIYSTQSSTTQGDFSYVEGSGSEATTPNYKAYYPVALYNEGTPALPATQTYVAGNIGQSPMYAESSNSNLAFKNISGIIRLNISTTQSGKKVRKIIVAAAEGMSGTISNLATLVSDNYVATVSGTEGVTLDCGATGIDIGSTAVPFHISVPAKTYTSLSVTVITTDGSLQTRTANKGITVERSSISGITLSFNDLTAATDLSQKESANTYIVSTAGKYKFKGTVKGNGGLDPMTGAKATTINPASIAGVKVIWELREQGRAIKHNGGCYEVFYSDGYVYFSTPNTWVSGVLCAAIYDASGTILWSWNIWSTSPVGSMTYNNNTFMDRNLLAVDLNSNRGFLYPWGRKDAFSAARPSQYSSFTFVPTLSTAFNTENGIHTMEFTIAHPSTMIDNGDANSWMSQEEYNKLPWRDDVKTIYDPCPAGWRVPTSAQQNGMSGLPGTGFSNSIDGFGNPDSGYYRSSTATTYPKAYAYRANGEQNQWGTNPAFAIRPVEDELTVMNLADYTDLSATATANSYIVSAAGDYKFRATVRGNGVADLAGISKNISVDDIMGSELLWATFGTTTAPASNELIRKVGYENGYVYFSTGSSGFQEGNAVVAIKDINGTILWSWHIWFTDDDLAGTAQTYPGGAVFMDRNLGALDNAVSPANYGLLYQWGRKDPFLNSSRTESGDFSTSTAWRPAIKGTTHSMEDKEQSPFTMAQVVEKPNSFLFQNSAYGGKWASDIPSGGGLWAENKTIFDPCPPGWKVPSSGHWDTEFRKKLFSLDYSDPLVIQTSTSTATFPNTGLRSTQVIGRVYNANTYEYLIRYAGEVVKPNGYHYRIWASDGALLKDQTYSSLETNGFISLADIFAGEPKYDLYYNSQYTNPIVSVILAASGCSVRCVREESQIVPVTSISLPSSATVTQYGGTKLNVTTIPAQCSYYELNWTSSDSEIADVNEMGYVAGISPGECTITATIPGVGSASCTVTVTASTSTTMEAVDLGLPSGTKWANMNYGASSPSQTGSWYNYYNNISLPSGWTVPTKNQCQELIDKCIWVPVSSGFVVFSTVNGNTVFLPKTGYKNSSNQLKDQSIGYYWTSDLYNNQSPYYLYVAPTGINSTYSTPAKYVSIASSTDNYYDNTFNYNSKAQVRPVQ